MQSMLPASAASIAASSVDRAIESSSNMILLVCVRTWGALSRRGLRCKIVSAYHSTAITCVLHMGAWRLLRSDTPPLRRQSVC